MKIFLGTLAVIFLWLAAFSAMSGSATISASGLLQRIERQGGHKVLWDLWEDDSEFGHVLDGIASGNPAWLQVASRLLPFSDAGASLSLHYALALALSKQPSRVLLLVGRDVTLEQICTSPFIEPDPGVAEAYERKALKALTSVKAPRLKALAQECMRGVRLTPHGS